MIDATKECAIILAMIALGLFTVVFSGKKGKEPVVGVNMVIVKNTEECENECYHIHHWMYFLVMLLIYFAVNLIFQPGRLNLRLKLHYLYLIALYIGVFISELIRYGPDVVTNISQDCFAHCSVTEN